MKKVKIGLLEPIVAHRSLKTGAGPLITWKDIKDSVSLRGGKVIDMEDYSDLPSDKCDCIIGVEQIMPFFKNLSPKQKIYMNKVYTISWCVPTWKDLFHNTHDTNDKDQLVGNKIIAVLGKEEYIPDYNSKKAEKYFVDMKPSWTIGFNLFDNTRKSIEEIVGLQSKNKKPVCSVLFGGAPTTNILDHVKSTLDGIARYIENKGTNHMDFKIYLGSMDNYYDDVDNFYVEKHLSEDGRHLSNKLDVLESNDNVKVCRELMDKDAYLSEVLDSDLIVTKPGWLAISEILYFSQLADKAPELILLEDKNNLPEYFSSRLLMDNGYEIVKDSESKTKIPELLYEKFCNIDYKKAKSLAGQFEITNPLDVIAADL